MIEFFSQAIGRPYPYAKYAQVCMPEFGGGMENITATTMTDQVLHDEIAELEQDVDGLVSHELAHQWFGDLLTCKDWSHLWLNEGFASYFGPLFTEHDRGEDAFRIEMHQEQQGYLGSDREYRRPIVEPRYESSDEMFDAMTYNKGACVLHMLRGLLGDDAWWKGIRRYVAGAPVRGGRDRRLPPGDGGGLGQGPEVVLRPVGLQGGPPRAEGPLALRGRGQDGAGPRSSRRRRSTSRPRCSACRRPWRSPRTSAGSGRSRS